MNATIGFTSETTTRADLHPFILLPTMTATATAATATTTKTTTGGRSPRVCVFLFGGVHVFTLPQMRAIAHTCPSFVAVVCAKLYRNL